MNAPTTQLPIHGDVSRALVPSFERRRLRVYVVQMLLDVVCIVGSFVLAGGIYLGTWPAPMALIEGQVLMPVYLTMAHFLHDADQVGGVGHVAVVEREALVRVVRILVDVLDPSGIEGGRTALDAMDLVTLVEQKPRHIGPVLTRHTSDQGTLATHPEPRVAATANLPSEP